MIGFSALLRSEGLDPANVKLVRHQPTRRPGQPTPYDLWRADDGRFELYQSIQRRPVFDDATLLASFVATPLNETLFVGLYSLNGRGTAKRQQLDPISGKNVGGYNLYKLTPAEGLKEYRARLLIEWGNAYRAWVQLAARQDKRVRAIHRSAENDAPFPGFLTFSVRLSALADVPNSWREVLSAVGGVYLLVHPESGKQYVGKASGEEGFWGRWESYRATGHGGNRQMRDIPAADYQVSVLEVVQSSLGEHELLEMESRWKQKLCTREFGLNAN